MHTTLEISNFFISKSIDTGVELTPLKLVKLTYISHGWHLGITDKPLLTEAIEAWKYGPVVPSVYSTFSKYGGNQITSLERYSRSRVPIVDNDFTREFLSKIWEEYGGFNGVELSSLTHRENTPWDIVWNQEGGKNKKNAIIRNDLIKSHYKEKINANRAQKAGATT